MKNRLILAALFVGSLSFQAGESAPKTAEDSLETKDCGEKPKKVLFRSAREELVAVAKVLGAWVALLGIAWVVLTTLERNELRKTLRLIQFGKILLHPSDVTGEHWERRRASLKFDTKDQKFYSQDPKKPLERTEISLEEIKERASKLELVFMPPVELGEIIVTDVGTYKYTALDGHPGQWILQPSA